ncbi:MAG: hypothetical protein IPK60_05465 [Sandaracinaceae bacterium]|nr:hypothetical protein [Sandaracinaceae bacterium]
MRIGFALSCAVAFAIVGTAVNVQAQGLNPRGRPNYGTRPISPGFSPDPISVPVVTGGTVDVASLHLGQGCVGYTAQAPDFQFTLTGPSRFLRIFVDAGQADTTLIVNRADGTWACADDTYGMNPGVDLVNAMPGVYNVWVGSYRNGERVNGTFAVTQIPSIHPAGSTATPSAPVTPAPAANNPMRPTAEPNFGSRRFVPGFRNDPLRIRITSGGATRVRDLNLGSGCTGYVTLQPDFVMNLTGESPQLRVYVNEARDNADTTLVIRRPDGSWLCNDDSFNGRNPSVDLDNAQPGAYAIWVGSYESEVQARARLNITELRDNHP